jgi:hypothetical protein
VLPFVPTRVVWRIGTLKARESGVATPRLFANHLRVVGRKRARPSVQAVNKQREETPREAEMSLDGPSQRELREEADAPLTQA